MILYPALDPQNFDIGSTFRVRDFIWKFFGSRIGYDMSSLLLIPNKAALLLSNATQFCRCNILKELMEIEVA